MRDALADFMASRTAIVIWWVLAINAFSIGAVGALYCYYINHDPGAAVVLGCIAAYMTTQLVRGPHR